MAKGRVAVAKAPPGGGLQLTGEGSTGYRLLANTMGTTGPILPALGSGGTPMPAALAGMDAVVTDERFEADELSDEEIRRREEEAGLPRAVEVPQPWLPEPGRFVPQPPRAPTVTALADLSALPPRFALEVERKESGSWVVRAPGVHVSLFVADTDLARALAQAPARLADIVALDGQVPVGRKRRKKA